VVKKKAIEISNEIGIKGSIDYVKILEEKVKRYEKVLKEISKESGTPYAEIAKTTLNY
jgi:hypothetical protein